MNTQQLNRAKDKIVIPGDVVYLKIQEVREKLSPRFEGPYRVIAWKSGKKVEVRNLCTYETKVVHLDHIQRVSRALDHGEEFPEDLTDNQTTQVGNKSEKDTNEYKKKLRSHSNNKK